MKKTADRIEGHISTSGIKYRWRIAMAVMVIKMIENTFPFEEYEIASGMSSVTTMYTIAPEEKPKLTR